MASATACALLGLPCVVYMGEEDIRRQAPNVARMKLLGTEVVPVTAGTRTLKEAVNAALRDWAASVATTHYIIGSVVGPHPFPVLVRDLQRVIGDEARVQYAERMGGDPDVVLACVGGGSNAIGMFTAFVGAPGVELIGVEAGGRGPGLGEHCSSITQGDPGVLHGALSYLLQDADGQVVETHSISAGLDYPGVGPEHAYLNDAGLARYVSATDAQALEGFQALARLEGILPALEPSHVIGWLLTRPAARRARACSCACPGAATRTSTPCWTALGSALMAALESALRARREAGDRSFVPYVTGGYPGVDASTCCARSRPPAPTPWRSASRSRTP